MIRITRGFIPRWRWHRILAAAALVAGVGFAAVPSQAATAASSICPDANVAAFGPNVCVFTDTMSQAAIQKDLDSIATQQVPVASQFNSQRYAVLFRPGTYGSAGNPLVFQVGYYTQVAGLGAMPRRSGARSSTAASSSRTTARTTTSPAAASSPTAR